MILLNCLQTNMVEILKPLPIPDLVFIEDQSLHPAKIG